MENIPSYLVEAEIYNELGQVQKMVGSVTKENIFTVLNRYNKLKNRRYPFKHNLCNGKGYLNFDDGKVFYDHNEERQVYSKWTKTCDCINKIVQKNSKLKSILLG